MASIINGRGSVGIRRSTMISSGPSIVTNGLILNLDAGQTSSYPGSGLNWYDISGNGNNGTLNGIGGSGYPSYNSANGGNITFDGTDDFVNLGDKDIFTNVSGFTFEAFFKPSSLTANPLFEKYQAGGYEYVGGFLSNRLYFLIYDNTTNKYIGRFVNNVTSFVTVNQWCHLSFVYTGGTLSNSIKLYINTIQRDDNTDSNGAITIIRNTNTSLTLARNNGGMGGPIKGSIGSIRMYNRALSASEITQNYDALKYRFGL